MKYVITDDFVVRNIVDECLVVRVSNSEDTDNTFYALNSTGKEIIDRISAGKTLDEIVDDFCNIFDIQKDVAENDVKDFIDGFIKLKILQVAE